MKLKEFFTGLLKPTDEQNEKIKAKMKSVFAAATGKENVDDYTLVFGNFEGSSDYIIATVSFANSYIVGFNRTKQLLILVPFKSNFSKYGEPIELLPGNLKKAGKSFIAMGYYFKDNEGNTYKMNLPEINGNLTAVFSENMIAISQKEEVNQFKQFYETIKS